MGKKIAVVRGDGVGPEVIDSSLRAIEQLGLDLEFVLCEAGYAAWRKHGVALSEDTLDQMRHTDACLKGPTQTIVGPDSFPSVVVAIRQRFELFANLRPLRSRKGVRALFSDVDCMLVRENTEGLYSGLEAKLDDLSIAFSVVSKRASERIAHFAFDLARRENRTRVTIVHKATVLKASCGLFRQVCFDVARNFPEIRTDELMVDTAAYKLVTNPREFHILLTTNIFGDILSDVGAGVTGGLGLAPSANIGENYALFEPIHGTGIEIAGKGIANPIAAIFSAALLLDHLGEASAARKLERTVENVLEARRIVTPDLGGDSSTTAMTNEVVRLLRDS